MIATHFTGAIFSAREARVVRWYVYHKRRATLLAGKSARPFGVGHSGPSGALRRLPDAPHRSSRTAPARVSRYDPMKWVAITEIWYKPVQFAGR